MCRVRISTAKCTLYKGQFAVYTRARKTIGKIGKIGKITMQTCLSNGRSSLKNTIKSEENRILTIQEEKFS